LKIGAVWTDKWLRLLAHFRNATIEYADKHMLKQHDENILDSVFTYRYCTSIFRHKIRYQNFCPLMVLTSLKEFFVRLFLQQKGNFSLKKNLPTNFF